MTSRRDNIFRINLFYLSPSLKKNSHIIFNMKTPAIRPLSEELANTAKNELNENPKKIVDDLEALRSWMAKQQHINGRTDDQFLIAFLRGCKYSLERAKEKIDMYYTVRTAIPEFFSARDVHLPKMQAIMELG